jgi:hypothetical protein
MNGKRGEKGQYVIAKTVFNSYVEIYRQGKKEKKEDLPTTIPTPPPVFFPSSTSTKPGLINYELQPLQYSFNQ